MGSRSRRKGAQWERALAERLRELWPSSHRGLGQTRSGSEVADVDGGPCWVEAKVGARPNPRAALDQAQDATDGRPVLVVVRDNGAGARAARDFVAMPLDDFIRLIHMERGRDGAAELRAALQALHDCEHGDHCIREECPSAIALGLA